MLLILCHSFIVLHAIPFSWYSHSTSRAFESVTFFSESLSVLSTLSTFLPSLTPESLFDTQFFLNTLCDSKVVHFQWIPGYSSLPSSNVADSLAKVGASLDLSTILLSLSPLISSKRLSLYTSWRRSIQSALFQHQIPTVSSEELTLPCSAYCTLSLFTLQREQQSSWHISSQGWKIRDSFLQQQWF